MIRGAVRRGRLVYKIVADVESYSEFLPYCLESTITAFDKATNSPSRAVLKVGWQQFEESFESKLQYTDSSVIAQAANTQMFNELYTKWTVTPLKGNHDKCVVDFALRFSFNNALYNTVSSSLGSTIASTMVKAFQKRAEDLANSN
ncbi:hypothetical protein TRICI_006729 [Trichomonascus ciferrii]|uniref:Coenzyme Q-binding protein COQ10 START domain-containing protein n=1 Tax=Trichomonascus ciferrii TaxID=44093 RepID=A0A642UI85_9ASCO|nr:hypothetical protein TRICI_006729 [Trichomonascus ciferrii]